MTWTYDPADLATSTLYQTRFMVGDTDSTDQLLQDEEITFLLGLTASPMAAAAEAADALAARFAREADQAVGRLSESRSQRSRAFAALAARLRAQISRSLVSAIAPYLGGQSISDKDAVREDTDRVQPYFSRDQFDIDAPRDDEAELLP